MARVKDFGEIQKELMKGFMGGKRYNIGGKVKNPFESPKIKDIMGKIGGKDNTRENLGENEKWDILRRQGFKCKGKCKPKASFTKIRAHFDHIKPVSKGGKKGKNLKNIQALCPNCHDNKSRGEHKKHKQRIRTFADLMKQKPPKIRFM